MKITFLLRQAFPFGALLTICFLFSCKQVHPLQKKHTFYRMDTVVDITLVIGGKKNRRYFPFNLLSQSKKNYKTIKKTFETIDSLLADWEIRFSPNHANSEVKKLNNRSTETVHVSPILAEMISTGIAYGDTLKGMFDLTILPLKELWGFGENNQYKESVPSDDSIQFTLQRINYSHVRVSISDTLVIFNDTTIIIDVGGIAKGFALREIGRLLDTQQFTDYLVVAGGDIIAQGVRPDGSSWQIGIQHPRKPGNPLGAFKLDSGCVVTSGDYERFWIKDGQRIHHIFNPKTGYSCTQNQSVTVWGMDPIQVDVLSTGLFGFPLDSIIHFIEQRPLLECLVIDSSGRCGISKGWVNKITFF